MYQDKKGMKLGFCQNLDQPGLEKLGIRGIQDTRQFALSQTNEAGPEAKRFDRTQSNAYLLQTT